MDVQGTSSIGGYEPIRGAGGRRPARQVESKGGREGDSVEISDVARLKAKISEVPEVRAERVAEIKQAIAEGRYLSGHKVDAAVDRLLDDLLA